MTLKLISKNSRHDFPHVPSLRPVFTLGTQSDQCVSSPITEKSVLVLPRRLRSPLDNNGSRERIGARSSVVRIRRRLLVRRRREERNRFLHCLYVTLCVVCIYEESCRTILGISNWRWRDGYTRLLPFCIMFVTILFYILSEILCHHFFIS